MHVHVRAWNYLGNQSPILEGAIESYAELATQAQALKSYPIRPSLLTVLQLAVE